MMEGEFFITPHAVEQFRSRLAPWMSYEQALGTIIRELKTIDEIRQTENKKAFYARTKGDWRFRAIISEGYDQPAVVTILRGK